MATPVAITYKRMLQLAQRLPVADRASAIEQIRSAFRAGKSADSSKAQELLAMAHKKLSYLRMVTPKYAVGTADDSSGAKKFVMMDGKLVETEGDSSQIDVSLLNRRAGSVDMGDAVKKHNANLARFQFRNRPNMPKSPFS